jgi:hypothetical protein
MHFLNGVTDDFKQISEKRNNPVTISLRSIPFAIE